MADNTSNSGGKSSTDKPSRASVKELALRLNPKSRYYQTIKDKSPRFALLLGAGASIESGIISAKEMIEDFINTICSIECPEKKDDKEKDAWLKANNYYKDEKDKYGSLFEKCCPTEVERREYIESRIDGKVPSLGYIALAHLIKNEIIDMVITTNFDDLVYQACTNFTDIRPIVFSLGGFASEISSFIKHPRVLKIHGDFMFSKLVNTREESAEPDPNMTEQIRQILKDYKGLFVVGYEGNDKSVVKLLEEIPDNKYLFWCVYEDTPVNPNIAKLLSKKYRYIVRTEGFEDLMMEICKIADIEYSELVSSYSHRMKDICDKFTSFGLKQPDIISSEEQQQKTSLDRQLTKVKNSFGVIENFVLGNKAYFNKDYNEAEKFYYKAKVLKPNEADAHYNYAKVLSENPLKFKEAEEEFKETIRLNPSDVSAYNRYANLLAKDKTREREAGEYYRKALDLDSDYFFAHFEYGNFLAEDKFRYGKAEEHYRKAIEIDPEYAETYYKLGILLLEDRRNEARNLFEKAIKLKPDFAAAHYQLDILLRDEDGKAEKEFLKAIELNPYDAYAHNRYANFLAKDKRRASEAEFLYRKVIKLKPDFAAAYYQLSILLRSDKDSFKKLDLKNKVREYKEQFFEFFLEFAVEFKTAGDEFNTKKFGEKAEKSVRINFINEFYKFAQVYSVLDKKNEAFENLKKAVEVDIFKKERAKWDPALKWIRDYPEFSEIVGE